MSGVKRELPPRVKRELPPRNRVPPKRYLKESILLKEKKESPLLQLSPPPHTSNEDNEDDMPMLERVSLPFAVERWLGSFPNVDPVFFQEFPKTVANFPLAVSPVSPKKGLEAAIVAAEASLNKYYPSFGAIDGDDN